MKKTLFYLLLASGSISAQQHKLDSITVVEPGNTFVSEVSKYTYTSNNNFLQITQTAFDNDNNHWHHPSTSDFEYDLNNNQTKEIFEYGTYNNLDQLTINKYRNERTFNSNNKLVENFNYYFLNGQWVTNSKTVYIYTVTGDLERKNKFNYINNNWTNGGRTEYYNSPGDSSYVVFNVNNDTTEIVESYYGSNNKINERFYYNFPNSNQSRSLSEKEVYTYNSNNELEKITFYYDETTPEYEYVFEYENGVNFNDVIIDVDNMNYWSSKSGKVLNLKAYDYNSGSWDLVVTHTYHFTTSTPTNIANFKLNNVLIYPNPTDNNESYITVEQNLEDVQVVILDALGKVVKSQTTTIFANQKTVLPIEGLVKGLYFVSLNLNGITNTQKLILK